MTETTKPKWMEGWQPTPAKGRGGNPTWVKGMPSPNPKGRPPGITDKKAKLAHRMLADADGIVGVMVDKALEGDTGAASLILSRVLPALRGQSEKVQFPFDADAPVSEQVAQVLDAVAAGAVAPDVGKLIIESVKALADVRAVEELEQRIVLLEAKEVR